MADPKTEKKAAPKAAKAAAKPAEKKVPAAPLSVAMFSKSPAFSNIDQDQCFCGPSGSVLGITQLQGGIR